MSNRITFDAEKVSFNLVKLRKGGENFEIAIDPDLIIKYVNKEPGVDIEDFLKSEHIYSDVKKGLLASDEKLKSLFQSDDVIKVSKILVEEGEIQFTNEYRKKLYDDKRKKIIEIINKKGIDPRTNLPHPIKRIENAFLEAKISVDYFKKPEEQVDNVVKKLRPILPIRFDTKKIEIQVNASYSSKVYGVLTKLGKVLEQNWLNDGGLRLVIEIPVGMNEEFFDTLNNITHGENQTKIY